jgi:hypothetical protein
VFIVYPEDRGGDSWSHFSIQAVKKRQKEIEGVLIFQAMP